MEYTEEEYMEKCAKDFEALVEAVEGIDQEAAKYLRENVKYEDKDGDLGCLFMWDSTPQGYACWVNIYEKLLKIGYYETSI